MDEVKGMFVGYSSYSNGDEGMGPVPEHENPDGFPHVRERIDAWAEAAKGVERKVFMGGGATTEFQRASESAADSWRCTSTTFRTRRSARRSTKTAICTSTRKIPS